MGTHCTIKVKGFNIAKVYKHWDGYPEATLPWLEAFNAEFAEKRGDDDEYKFAQLLRSSAFDSGAFKLDSSRETGWGVIGYSSEAGEAYEYTLEVDGSVTVKEML
jgi:hypothetical protein